MPGSRAFISRGFGGLKTPITGPPSATYYISGPLGHMKECVIQYHGIGSVFYAEKALSKDHLTLVRIQLSQQGG
jgi:hypothetical protein